MTTTDYRDWIGRCETIETDVSAELVQRTAALLDREVDTHPGAPVPPQWYCVLFGENARQSLMGPDGHPLTGDFLPPIPLPRRMLAGRTVTFDGALRIGERVSRVSTVHDIQNKEGASGHLCFVTIRHVVRTTGSQKDTVIEDQTVVYKQEPAQDPGTPTKAPRRHRLADYATPEGLAQCRRRAQALDNTVLFRYSALTYNAHRIHYDHPYATTVEHYPGLVVNGGLRQLLMWDFAEQSGIAIRRSAVRNLQPAFAGDTTTLHLLPAGDGWQILESEDDDTVSAIMTLNQEQE